MLLRFPVAFGNLVPELKTEYDALAPEAALGIYPKTLFSMVIPEVKEKLAYNGEGRLPAIVLIGIEVRVHYVLDLMDPQTLSIPQCL